MTDKYTESDNPVAVEKELAARAASWRTTSSDLGESAGADG